jgi:hypothetical protein
MPGASQLRADRGHFSWIGGHVARTEFHSGPTLVINMWDWHRRSRHRTKALPWVAMLRMLASANLLTWQHEPL